jgi:hypothetical protein
MVKAAAKAVAKGSHHSLAPPPETASILAMLQKESTQSTCLVQKKNSKKKEVPERQTAEVPEKTGTQTPKTRAKAGTKTSMRTIPEECDETPQKRVRLKKDSPGQSHRSEAKTS